VIALVAEMLVALFTVGNMVAVVAECLVALVTDDPVFALKTERSPARSTVESVFALSTTHCLANFAKIELSAVEAKSLLALSTVEHFFAMRTQ
jgi:hypothetical protein